MLINIYNKPGYIDIFTLVHLVMNSQHSIAMITDELFRLHKKATMKNE